MEIKNLNELAAEIHQNAVAHGWWEEDRSIPEVLMLCVSELAEALEEYREDQPTVWYACNTTGQRCGECTGKDKDCPRRSPKPEGIAVEMADCIIRILDWCGKEGVDIDAIISAKHEYNKSRPYRHGGKKC